MNRTPTILLCVLLAGCAFNPRRQAQPSEASPAHTTWTRSYTLPEFEKEIADEDRIAKEMEAKGGVFIRMFPTPAYWADVRRKHPHVRVVWRYEPDGSDFVDHATLHMAGGADFAAVDEAGRPFFFLNSIAYMATRTR